MSDPVPIADNAMPSLELTPTPREDPLAHVEERLARLEQDVAQLQDTAALEERVVRRLREAPPSANAWADKFQRELPAPPPPEPPSITLPPLNRTKAKTTWLLFDAVRELRLIYRMFRDPRYRVAKFTWLIVLLFMPLILLSDWWFPLAWIPWVGVYLDKIMNVILAFFVYKALSREAKRYQEAISHVG